MKADDVCFIPLNQETLELAKTSKEYSDKTRFRLADEEEFRQHDLGMLFFDAETALDAAEKIFEFRKLRKELNYYAIEPKITHEQTIRHFRKRSPELARLDSSISITTDDIAPYEQADLLETVVDAVLHYLPVHRSIIISLERYVDTYAAMRIYGFNPISIRDDHDYAPTSVDIYMLMKLYLRFAGRILSTVLDHCPIDITIQGTVKKLEVLIDGKAASLAARAIRGIAALALLEYDHWFSNDDFCTIAFPGNATYEPRKQFDAALSPLRQFSPFGWDADEGLRRIKGAVITSNVDKAVLHAYLNQKRTSDNA